MRIVAKITTEQVKLPDVFGRFFDAATNGERFLPLEPKLRNLDFAQLHAVYKAPFTGDLSDFEQAVLGVTRLPPRRGQGSALAAEVSRGR